MRVDLDLLRTYIEIDCGHAELKELLASIGLEVAEIIDVNGATVFEVEITPNRPDWLSHIGIAREIHAKIPDLIYHLPTSRDWNVSGVSEEFSIEIENSEDCGRYTGCIVRDIEVKESTEEIKAVLRNLGLRPINNIVDISNFVLMTTGHPLHIFDLDNLKGNVIKIRRAQGGETLKLLTEEILELNEDQLVIADREHPVALAGVMGGKDSGVTFETKNIFVESAYFNPIVVRKSARLFGMKTDASYRFERGADILATKNAMNMALDLIQGYQAEALGITYLKDNFPLDFHHKEVRLPKDFPGHYTGIDIEEKISVQVLESLGFGVEDKDDFWMVKVPSYRVDIYGKQDLVEEIIRIYGYDKLGAQIPATTNIDFTPDVKRDFIQKARHFLTSLGYYEAINFIFHGLKDNQLFSCEDREDSFLEIKNPLGKDYSVMRNSLLAGLLRNTALNFNQGMSRVCLFEFGRIFVDKKEEIDEIDNLAIVAAGEYKPANWAEKKSQPFDFYIFKSLITAIADLFFLPVEFKKRQWPALHEDCSFEVEIDGVGVGFAGLLAPEIRDHYKMDVDAYVAELDMERLISRQKERSFTMWTRYPASKRDFSFLMDRTYTFDFLRETIEELKPQSLESYGLADLYDGENIPSGKVSLSMSFSYRDSSRTLTNEEVNDIHNQFVAALAERLTLIQR